MRTLRSIRHRLALLLALPTGALVILGAIGTADRAGRFADAGRTGDRVALVVATEEFVHQLQRERGLTAGLLGGETSFRAQLGPQREAADQARRELDRRLADDPPGAEQVRGALGGLGTLARLRGRADTGAATRTEALEFFTGAVTALNTAAFADRDGTGDRRLADALATLRSLGEATEATALERGTLNGVLAAGSFRNGEYPAFVRITAVRAAALAGVPRTASPARAAALDAVLRGPDAVTVAGMEQQALDGWAADRLPVRADAWWRAASALVDGLYEVQSQAAADSRTRADELRSQALRGLLVNAGLALAAAVGAALLGLLATRSITRPVAALAGEAEELADRVLPEAVERAQAGGTAGAPGSTAAAGTAELEVLGAALDRVAGTALRLAVEQSVLRRNTAESLAGLGRRNQALVTRQLGLLSTLESGEHDPAALANLFELDHLATRMRRNAESLLVLVGEASPRRWPQPVALGDVVRSALGEVEDYRRVVLRRVDGALVDGGAVAELAHLLAELIENALAASPPDTDVEVFTRVGPDGCLVAVVDRGPGMDEAALDRANARLAGRESFLLGEGGLLGHYVVGRLAERLGAVVRLAPAPVHGVTATVALPPALLVSAPRQVAGGVRA
ncbi:signal transduction histidine kinase [Streptomyces sp. TLI_235]|nr:nitrate- and nitrite sensing domain-containing protein [Streptomyces sp. TLI_235]PBC77903.1 signal transduction histidine kinase [Streptomyces sp. TLI_235]